MIDTSNSYSVANRLINAGRGIVDDFQEALMRDHDEAMEVTSLEEVIGALSGVVGILTPKAERIVARFYKNDKTIPSYNERRTLIACFEDLHAEVSDRIVQDGRKFVNEDYDVEGLDNLVEMLAKMKKAIEKLKKTCPEPNENMLARTAQNILSGHFKPAKELRHGDGRS